MLLQRCCCRGKLLCLLLCMASKCCSMVLLTVRSATRLVMLTCSLPYLCSCLPLLFSCQAAPPCLLCRLKMAVCPRCFRCPLLTKALVLPCYSSSPYCRMCQA